MKYIIVLPSVGAILASVMLGWGKTNKNKKETKAMKKALTLALVAALLTATGITAYATDITADSDPKTGGTNVTYEVAPVYTVVIPESVTLGDTAVTEQIKIYGATADDNVVIGKTQKVNVALTESANGFKVKTADGDEVAYTVNDKNAVDDLTTVAKCAAGAKTDTNITFTKTGTAAYAGTYTDTLTFTVSVTDAEVPVTSVSIDNKAALQSTNFVVGQEIQLTATVTPDNATDKTVTWSKQGMISVDPNGKVTFTGVGYAIINVTAGGASDSVILRADPKTINIEPNNPNNPIKP